MVSFGFDTILLTSMKRLVRVTNVALTAGVNRAGFRDDAAALTQCQKNLKQDLILCE